jgi:DNA-binding MarR family transcriptional regulator
MKSLLEDDLFSARSRASDPDTSHDAAQALKASGKLTLDAIAVLTTIGRSGPAGANRREIHNRTGILIDTVSPRLSDLLELSFIERRTDPVSGKNMRRNGMSLHWCTPRGESWIKSRTGYDPEL